MAQKNSQREWYLRNRARLLEKAREYREKNKATISVQVAKWHKENPARMADLRRAWVARNPAKNAASKKAYEASHPGARKGRSAKRRARRAKATPRWLTLEQRQEINRIYRACPPGHHVDHIVPIAGKNVRGLHVPWNLQYLPAAENFIKGNR